jgi:PPOX class probable F420-dependent enzyme
VTTPVNLVLSDGKAYVFTAVERGKARRIRNDPRVRLAPATYSGKVTGPAHAGTARIMDAEESRPIAGAFRRRFPSATGSRPSGSA